MGACIMLSPKVSYPHELLIQCSSRNIPWMQRHRRTDELTAEGQRTHEDCLSCPTGSGVSTR